MLKIDQEKAINLLAIKEMTITDTAKELKRSYQTVRGWIRTNKEFADKLEQVREKARQKQLKEILEERANL
ncbi:hypothetical protein G8T75_12835 [Clostridium botulinum D/C]|uniref:helix-turn-helix domain-containing protein n=1 Tax=Clostridium botulinum TaxID=1491 RepID=UPI001E63CC73|nr:helix-turn-helix domain-containing protein [Clostridium botulinum]MCD3240843.1 hypothetical protein [Clostridium botulinum D/C]